MTILFFHHYHHHQVVWNLAFLFSFLMATTKTKTKTQHEFYEYMCSSLCLWRGWFFFIYWRKKKLIKRNGHVFHIDTHKHIHKDTYVIILRAFENELGLYTITKNKMEN